MWGQDEGSKCEWRSRLGKVKSQRANGVNKGDEG